MDSAEVVYRYVSDYFIYEIFLLFYVLHSNTSVAVSLENQYGASSFKIEIFSIFNGEFICFCQYSYIMYTCTERTKCIHGINNAYTKKNALNTLEPFYVKLLKYVLLENVC